MLKRRIYLDCAAATPVDPEVVLAMEPYWREVYANPNAHNTEGRMAFDALETARKTVADFVDAQAEEVIFTSGGTEANSIAIRSTLDAYRKANSDGGHIVTSAIEHPSVLDLFRQYEKERGFRLTILPVDADGRVSEDNCADALSGDTVLVSIMYANNEMGALQPIPKCAKSVRNFREKQKTQFPLFHTDASQGPIFFDITKDVIDADLITLDAQKIYGPKGVGALIVRTDIIFHTNSGGSQERGIRPGTQNVPAIVGFARACELVVARRDEDMRHAIKLQRMLIDGLTSLTDVVLNGSRAERMPNNVNVSLLGIEGEYAVAKLDMLGIAASTRSACISDSFEGSYVISAIDPSRANSSVRFTTGRGTTEGDISRTIDAVKEVIAKGRVS